MKKMKNVKNRWIKKTLSTNEQNYSNQMKTFFNKTTVSVSYSVQNNVWEPLLFIREFPVAAMLNPSLKSRFM